MTATLADQQQIRDLVASYCRGVDRLDLDLIRSCYAPDGIDHHTGFDGSADEYVAWLARGLPRLGGTMHTVGQTLVEVRGDAAVAETYGFATHWGTPASEPALNFTTGFRYVDDLVRLEGRWLIRERFAIREWLRRDAGPSAGCREEGDGSGPSGSRTDEDPVLRLLAGFRADAG